MGLPPWWKLCNRNMLHQRIIIFIQSTKIKHYSPKRHILVSNVFLLKSGRNPVQCKSRLIKVRTLLWQTVPQNWNVFSLRTKNVIVVLTFIGESAHGIARTVSRTSSVKISLPPFTAWMAVTAKAAFPPPVFSLLKGRLLSLHASCATTDIWA